jgi:alpha-galactosidase
MATEIAAVIDGFAPPRTIKGWATKRVDKKLVFDLRIMLRRGKDVLASVSPSLERRDVTGDETGPAGFSVTLPKTIPIEDLLSGAVTVQVTEPGGKPIPVPIWGPTEAAIRDFTPLEAARQATGTQAMALLDALAGNPNLAAHPIQVQKLAEKLVQAAYPPIAKPGPKITLIGAGSTVFAKNLLGDILLYPALRGATVFLYDIDPERLRVSEAVARRICATLDAPATITATLDLTEALTGANFAITMIQVGGYEPSTVIDFDIPNQFGLRQTIADTLGIGGIMRALRTIPALLEITRAMERLCPDVLHINYANPMAMNCMALSRASPIKTIGLCHSVRHTAAELARDAGVDPDAVRYLAAGINHMVFYLKLTANGENLYPKLRQHIADGTVPGHNRVRYDMLKRLNYFVSESSEHFAEYVPWYIKSSQPELIQKFNIPLDEYPRRCRAQIADWEGLAATLLDPEIELEVRPSQEYGAEIINAITTGQPCVVYANVPNEGYITNLPTGCCVEIPCLVDHNGVQPVRIGALPPHLAALMQTNINVQTLPVEAALTGKREHVYHAAMLDPHTAAELNLDQIFALVDALLTAHQQWLPKGWF